MGVRFFPGAPNDPMIHPSFWPHPNKKKGRIIGSLFLEIRQHDTPFWSTQWKNMKEYVIFICIYIYIYKALVVCVKNHLKDHFRTYQTQSFGFDWVLRPSIECLRVPKKRVDTDPGWSLGSLSKCFYSKWQHTNTVWNISVCMYLYTNLHIYIQKKFPKTILRP